MHHLIKFIVIIYLISIFAGCHQNQRAINGMEMDIAESLMESKPDSALIILNNISSKDIMEKKDAARYSLLKSMALDKNFIDMTIFDTLQPAIDYYLINGTSKDKVYTLYYQGRIFQNLCDDASAMRCFMSIFDVGYVPIDTLLLARTYVAMGMLYYKLYLLVELN